MVTALERYKKRLEQYYEAEEAILSGAQSYKVGSRSLTRANLNEIADMIKYLENRVAAERSVNSGKGRNKITGVVPRDF